MLDISRHCKPNEKKKKICFLFLNFYFQTQICQERFFFLGFFKNNMLLKMGLTLRESIYRTHRSQSNSGADWEHCKLKWVQTRCGKSDMVNQPKKDDFKSDDNSLRLSPKSFNYLIFMRMGHVDCRAIEKYHHKDSLLPIVTSYKSSLWPHRCM